MRAEAAGATPVARIAVPPAWRDTAEEMLGGLGARPLYISLDALAHTPDARDVVAIATDEVVDGALLDLPRLRVVSLPGTGVWEFVDTAGAAERGIAVCNIRDYATDAVAEHTWALILATAKRLRAADDAVRAQTWPGPPWGRVLAGRTLGLLGVGAVGRRVAQIARVFGMRVVAWSARPVSAAADASGADQVLRYVSREEVLQRSDVVSLHGRYEPGMPPVLGAEEIGALRRGAIVVNTARGGLLDATALAVAVSSGALGGAGLDVFDTEPLPCDSPLRDVPGVLLTPHVAAATAEAQREAVSQCLRNVVDFLAGAPRNVVNLPVGRGAS